MSKVWAWLSIIVIVVMILGLLVIPAPPAHKQGATLVIIRSAQEAQPPAKAPPGAWLVVRRIPRPEQ